MPAGDKHGADRTFSHPLARAAAIFRADDGEGNPHNVLAIVTTLDLDPKSNNYKKPQAGATRAYLDGELCGIDDAGMPSFSQTQAASDGERGVRLVYYAFDLVHLDGRDTAGLPLIERKALLEPLVANVPARPGCINHGPGRKP